MLEQTPREQRQQFVDVEHKVLSLRRQCELLKINRSTLYYNRITPEADDISLLNEIRDIWERYPFYGYRRITLELKRNGHPVNHKRIQRLMNFGGISAIFPGPNTSRRNKAHAIYPYLLRGVDINRPNQAWMVDITYLKLNTGFVYLVGIIDVYSRYIVGWCLSTTLDTGFCMEALQLAMKMGQPEIVNSDQGCQFTSADWVNFLTTNQIQISMTGKGRCTDNIFIERFWRSIKQEEFYLNDYPSIKILRKAIASYMDFYNYSRPHQALGYQTPASRYLNEAPAAVVGF